MNRLPTIICIAYLFISNISAQVPSNFNFLNHSFQNFENDEVTVVKLINDELIAVHNRGFDYVGYDYQLKEEWHPYASEYKFISENDSTYHYASWIHSYGDAIAETLITNSIIDGESVRHSYDDVLRYDVFGFDITHDTTGGWWCVSNFGIDLLYLKDGEIIDTFNVNAVRPKIYTSCSGDIYLIRFGEVQYFDGQELIYINDLPRFDQAYQYNGYNYLLDSDKLYKYDCEMKTKLNEWSLPIPVSSFNQIEFGANDDIYINEINSASYNIYSIDSTSLITSEYLGAVEDNERIDGIKVISDSIHMIFGQHQFELSSQTFYRSYNTKQHLDYPTVDVQISDFDIDYFDGGFGIDIFTGDSVNVQRSKSELIINNLGSDSIHTLDVFSNNYRIFVNGFNWGNYISAGIDSVLPPLESRKADHFFLEPTTLEELENIRVELTGANYKFLENGSQVLAPNLLLSSIESTEFETFSIYPNPVSDFINVNLSQDDEVSIFSSDGKLCSQYNVATTSDRIEVSALEPGMYFIILRNENKPAKIAKFVKL